MKQVEMGMDPWCCTMGRMHSMLGPSNIFNGCTFVFNLKENEKENEGKGKQLEEK